MAAAISSGRGGLHSVFLSLLCLDLLLDFVLLGWNGEEDEGEEADGDGGDGGEEVESEAGKVSGDASWPALRPRREFK